MEGFIAIIVAPLLIEWLFGLFASAFNKKPLDRKRNQA